MEFDHACDRNRGLRSTPPVIRPARHDETERLREIEDDAGSAFSDVRFEDIEPRDHGPQPRAGGRGHPSDAPRIAMSRATRGR
jgi:hypothetical protein